MVCAWSTSLGVGAWSGTSEFLGDILLTAEIEGDGEMEIESGHSKRMWIGTGGRMKEFIIRLFNVVVASNRRVRFSND